MTKRILAVLLLGVLLFGAVTSASAEPAEEQEESRSIRIGVWAVEKKTSKTTEGIQSVVDFGADYIMHATASDELFDACDALGLDVYIQKYNLPYGTMKSTIAPIQRALTAGVYDSISETYRDRDCIASDYLYDEITPKEGNFLTLARMVQKYADALPDKEEPIIGINAYYWEEGNLAVDYTFEEYVDLYCKLMPLSYIMPDLYPWRVFTLGSTIQNVHPRYLHSMDTIAEACRKYGKDLRMIVQAGTNETDFRLNEAQMRSQVYLALAYGADDIIYACYNPCWWKDGSSLWEKASGSQVGNATDLWEICQTVNEEIDALSADLTRFDSVGTYCFGTTRSDLEEQFAYQNSASAARGFGEDSFRRVSDVTAVEGGVVAGCFAREDGESAVLFVNLTDPFDMDASATVTWRADGEVRAVYRGQAVTLTPDENGVYSFTIPSGDGLFVSVK